MDTMAYYLLSIIYVFTYIAYLSIEDNASLQLGPDRVREHQSSSHRLSLAFGKGVHHRGY